MAYRQTFVIEYPDASLAPRVSAGAEMLGGKLVGVQFDDALEEIEALQECCMPDDLIRAKELQEKMKTER